MATMEERQAYEREQLKAQRNRIKRITLGAIGAILLIIALSLIGKVWEEVDAGEVVVIQHMDGELVVYDQPTSWAVQWFGKVTHYKRSNQFEFLLPVEKGGDDHSIPVLFNDGGGGKLSGSIRYDLPISKESMINIHKHFNSQASLEEHLIKTNIEKAVFASGPLMSSRESFAEKKNNLIFYIEDQASKGAYQTQQVDQEEVDQLSGVKKMVTKVQILKDAGGKTQRQEISPILTEGVRLYNLSIKTIEYDDKVKGQIAAQQGNIMAVQTSIAEAKKAEQKAITIEKEGQAEAAKAKWDQEVIKARLVTEAQAQKEKATLDVQTAQLVKQKLTLEGEGEAAKKRAAMLANGALEQKLAAWLEAQKYWADALSNYTGSIVPAYISGGGAGQTGGNNAFQNFMEMSMFKTARDLDLNINPNDKKK